MDKRIFDTMKNGYNRYQVDDYMQTQKLQMDALQKKLESVNRELEMLRQEKKVLENEYRKLNEICISRKVLPVKWHVWQ